MLYEEYEQKIIKKAKVRRVFYRFRVLIILVIALIVGSSGTLAGTKGVVLDKKKVDNNTYYYGEIYEYLSEAFLSTVDYEFSYNHSDEWTSEMPKLIGHYTLRSKSKNIVNSYYYGALQEFDIIPKPIDIEVFESNITYGDKPSINISSQLEYGDVLSNEYKFDYGDMSKESWNISPVLSSLHIYSSSGEDVTNCYQLNLRSKNVRIDKRALAIRSSTNSKVYDGTELIDNRFEIIGNGLAFEDTIVCDNYTSITNASVELNNQTYVITNKDGVNVTDHYDISLTPGTLTIEKRPIILSIDSYEYTYDGLDHKFDLNNIKLEGTLANGETIEYYYANNNQFINANKYTNEFTYKVLKGNVDVTNNYAVTTNFGETKINKRPLKLSSPSYEYTYNGKNQKFELGAVIQEGTLADDENLVLSYAKEDAFRDAGEYSNSFTYQIKHGEKDVTDNYVVTTEFGNTVINKRLISFTSKNYERIYNGENQIFSLDEIETSSGELAEDESVTFSYKDVQEMFDAATYTNSFNNVIHHGEEDVTKNYTISQTFGTTIINKRPIKVKSDSFVYTYDGLDHKFDLGSLIIDGEIAEGDQIQYSYKDNESWIKVGEYKNEFDIAIKHGDRDVTKNYEIEYEFGTTTINKCPITITTEDVTKTYDAIEVVNKAIVIQSGSLATTDKIEVDAPSFVDAGIYKNKITVSILNKETNKDFTDCYEIELLDSTITINKVELEIQIEQKTVVYNGKEHTNSYHISSGELVAEDKLKELKNAKYVDAGTYDNNDLDVTVIKNDKDETDNLKNYNLTYQGREGAIKIEKRNLYLDIYSFEKLYDAVPIQDTINEDEERYEITSGTFAENEYMTIEFTNNPTDAGEYDIEYVLTIYHKAGEKPDVTKDKDVTYNYEIHVDEGKYKINQRTLDISTLDYEHVYNRVSTFTKDEKVYEISEECDGLLPTQHIATFDITCDELNVGTYTYTIDLTTFKIEDNDKNDVTHNYKLTVTNNGEVTIIKRDINVKILTNTHIYDGKNFTSADYNVTNILKGDYLQFVNLPSLRHVFEGSKVNEPESISVLMSDETDVTSNYNIIIDSIGTISILPREITLSSSSVEKDFDGKMLDKGGGVTVSEGTLADCDTLTVTILYSRDNDYVHAVESSNYFEFTLIDDEDTNVLEDYSITIKYGKVTINPCKIVLDVYSNDIVYDGNTYSVHESETDVSAMTNRIYIVEGEMPELYYLDVEVNIASMQKPGIYAYEDITTDYRTDSIYGVLASDFDLSFVEDSQQISPRQINIMIPGGSKLYDGMGFYENKNEEDIWYIGSGSLALGDTIYEITYEDVTEIGNYGYDTVQFSVLTILDSDTMEDVTDCYSIGYTFGGICIYEE